MQSDSSPNSGTNPALPMPAAPLTTAAEIQALVQELSGETIISFDTEFIRESTFFPKLEVLQIGTHNKTWLIDIQAFKKGLLREIPAGLKPLLDVLQDPKVLKIVHAAQADQECLFTSFGVLAAPVIDTEVAASLAGYGDGLGLANLLKNVLGISLKKGHARTDWSMRPLPRQQLEYAHADVEHLVELGESLLRSLDKINRREWALKLSSKWNDPFLHEPTPESIADRLSRGGRIDRKAYPVLLELVRWRERRVREVNVPRRWLADDAVLVDLAQVRPKDIAHLSQFRGLSRGEIKQNGENLLKLIAESTQLQVQKPQSGPSQEPASEAEEQAMDLLKCYVGMLADRNNVAMKHILLTDQMLRVLRAKPKTIEELQAPGLLSADAARLIGNDLIDFLHGRVALSIDENKVLVVRAAGK